MFESFSLQHFSALIVFALFTFLAVWFGWNSSDTTKKWIGLSIAFAALFIMVFDSIYRLMTGRFDILDDLPLFLCDIVACMLPFIILTKNRKWMGILYFWAVAGTLQALITPELEEGFPRFEFFRYFIMHAGIVSAVIYCIVVWRIKINWKDFFNAIMFAQVYIVFVHIINILLNSNYSYTVRKPNDPSVLDLMGDWPWYIFWGEILMIVLFLLLMIPFLFETRTSRKKPIIRVEMGQEH
ncbi:MAG: TIGR02206 family membrane protein [Saprospiraceae bacterium]